VRGPPEQPLIDLRLFQEAQRHQAPLESLRGEISQDRGGFPKNEAVIVNGGDLAVGVLGQINQANGNPPC
jgi:hypothetical protein